MLVAGATAPTNTNNDYYEYQPMFVYTFDTETMPTTPSGFYLSQVAPRADAFASVYTTSNYYVVFEATKSSTYRLFTVQVASSGEAWGESENDINTRKIFGHDDFLFTFYKQTDETIACIVRRKVTGRDDFSLGAIPGLTELVQITGATKDGDNTHVTFRLSNTLSRCITITPTTRYLYDIPTRDTTISADGHEPVHTNDQSIYMLSSGYCLFEQTATTQIYDNDAYMETNKLVLKLIIVHTNADTYRYNSRQTNCE